MSTIVNNPAERERIVETSDTGGWAVAVIVLLAVLAIGGFLWMRYMTPAATPTTTTESSTPGSANINVTLPANTDTSGSNSTEASGGTNQPVTSPSAQ